MDTYEARARAMGRPEDERVESDRPAVAADIVAAARARVRGRARSAQAEVVPLTRLPLDGLVGMGDAHPYHRVLARSSGRRQTIRAIESNTKVATHILRTLGACGVPSDEPAWDDPYVFPWHRFSEHDATVLMAALTETTRKANTFAARVNRVRAILKQLRRQRLIDRDCLEECLEVLKAPSADDSPAGRALEESEIEALFGACARDPKRRRGARDAAILAVLFTTGMRGGELCDLDLADYHQAARELEILPKGRRTTRLSYLTAKAAAYLERWITERGDDPGPLFVRWQSKTPRLTVDALDQRLWKLVEVAGIAHFSSHDCRRTVATRLLRVVDIAVVMKVLGHKHPTTTARYDRANGVHLREAVDQIELPGRRAGSGDGEVPRG